MVQQIINAIVPVAITAVVAVLVAVIKGVGDAAVSFIQKKKDAVVAKMGADTYNQHLSVARQMWGAVDEDFRITPTLEKTIQNKQAEFAKMIKKAIPGIADDEIGQLRQAVAGEVNKGREALTAETLVAKSGTAKDAQDTAARALQSAVEAVQAAQKVVGGTAQTPAGSKGAA